jgi:hypothetical protein
MTYETLASIGRNYNRQHAPGSETSEWQDFVAEVVLRTGDMPWSDSLATKIVPQDMCDYWVEIFSMTH